MAVRQGANNKAKLKLMITVQLASVPEREAMLEKTIKSLRPQVDKIWVGLNKYQHRPKFLREVNTSFLITQQVMR